MPEGQQLVGLCGRICRGRRAADFQGLAELTRKVVFMMGCDGLQSLRGREQYLAASAAFQRQLREEAAGAAVSLVRVAQLDPETVSVRYNVSWVPPNAAWLETLGRAVPGWRVVKVATLCAQREIMCIEIG